jgi:hypothetical protein
MPGTTLEARIQAATKIYRDVDLEAMNEAAVRAEALARDIDGSETTPLVTLRAELAEQYRNRLRKNAYPKPVAGPGTGGNPGNDWVALSDA